MALNPNASSFAPPMSRALPSVKHLTCYYWANGTCKYKESSCLYSHAYTGRMAGKPVKLEHNKPAVAGRNAQARQPVHQDWRKQLEEGNAKQREIDRIVEESEMKRLQAKLFEDMCIMIGSLRDAINIHQSDIGQAARRVAEIYHEMKEAKKDVPSELAREIHNILRAVSRHELLQQDLNTACSNLESRKDQAGWGRIGGQGPKSGAQ